MPVVEFKWKYTEGQKRHTQDGAQLAHLMKSTGLARQPCLAVDVGCGDGIIAHEILVQRRATKVLAFDVSSKAVEAARHNLAGAIADGRAEVFKTAAARFFRDKSRWDRFDRFVINPPFFAAGSGKPNKRPRDQMARHDQGLSLKIWAAGARKLLKTGGELYCVFPTERLGELLTELSNNRVEPKEIWWFKEDLRKRRFFLRAVRGARPGLIVHFDHSESF